MPFLLDRNKTFPSFLYSDKRDAFLPGQQIEYDDQHIGTNGGEISPHGILESQFK